MDRRPAGQGASGEHAILVRAPGVQRDISVKLEKYFGARWMSGGGECEVTMLDRQTYRAVFQDKDAHRRVLQKEKHVIETTEVTVHDESQEGLGSHCEKQAATTVNFGIGAAQRDLQKLLEDLKIPLEIYPLEMENLERRYQVKIVQPHISDGSTYLNFNPQGSQSSPKSAQDKFTDKVQEVMGGCSQEKVDSSIVQLPLADLKQSVKDLWSKVLVIQQDSSFILRGPKEQVSEAKKFLETLKSARPRRPLTLSSSDTLTEIPVDRRHLDILRRLKSREISDIEQKYQVQMEDGKKSKKDGIVFITFRAVNGCPDLSPQAAHSFITLLQKTLFNVKKTVIRLGQDYTEERVHSLQEKLKAGGADLIMECSDGSLHIIGHPLHVSFAVDIILGIPESNGAQAAPMSEMDREEPMDTSEAKGDEQRAEEDDKCPICLSMFSEKEVLPKCKHAFCKGCLKQAMAHKPVCPICSLPYGEIRGDQPDGTMTDRTHKSSLPGYSGHGTIEITYSIPNGIQQENHPRPGTRFHGATRKAYLPDNMEGREILRLLRKAFDRRLIFTVGDSRTTGATDTVTWNDIHHKTSTHGGTGGFGYPDPNYLKRVRDELKAKGIE